MSLGSQTSYLDVSPSGPVARSVHIPIDSLPGRLHELPERKSEFFIIGEGAPEAVEWLRQQGWTYATLGQAAEATEGTRLWSPNPFLLRVLPDLQPGHAVDFGCGGGREAIALATCGFQVLAVDRLLSNLDRGQNLASRFLEPELASRIEWRQCNFERSVASLKTIDLAVSFFALDRELFRHLNRRAERLVIEAFTSVHRETMGQPRSDTLVVEPGELPTLFPDFEVALYEEGWLRGRHTARLYARRAL